jgi:hypothetical protein
VTHDKTTIQLGQFFDGSAEVGIGDVAGRFRMPQQWIQNQRSGSCQHCIFISKRKQCANPSSLPTFARNFDGKFQQRLKNVGIVFRHLAENTLKHQSDSSHCGFDYPSSLLPVFRENETIKSLGNKLQYQNFICDRGQDLGLQKSLPVANRDGEIRSAEFAHHGKINTDNLALNTEKRAARALATTPFET